MTLSIVESLYSRLSRERDNRPEIFLQDLMIGEEASKLRSMLEISYPMQNGIVR